MLVCHSISVRGGVERSAGRPIVAALWYQFRPTVNTNAKHSSHVNRPRTQAIRTAMNICRDAHRLSLDVAQTSPSRLGSASVADLARAAGATVRFREETTMKVLAALVLGVVLFAAVPALAHDVDGKWTGTGSTPMGGIRGHHGF